MNTEPMDVQLPVTLQQSIYRKMIVVRRLEERLGEYHTAGKTRGPLHRSDGQEAAGVAAASALRKDDYLCTTHRGHAHYVGKGLDVRRIVAEIFGRQTGYCKGRAGHMLVADAEYHMLGGNAIVGAGLPMAVGQALSIQLSKTDQVALCCFGDGAAQTGICHEAMNIAALWHLPVIFFLENNQYGLTVPLRVHSSIENLSVRAQGYGFPGITIDGNDFLAVYGEVAKAVARARSGDGPTLIEAKTYRLTGFSTSDMGGYQPKDEMDRWRERDPIQRAYQRLRTALDEDTLQELRVSAEAEVDRAFEQALADPFPAADDVYRGEYAQ